MFDELYGSESLSQVYAIMIEYLSCLSPLTRQNLVEICYDDACHFKKFGENEKRANFNEVTKFMAGLGKHVDKFHFPNHVDSWCHANCNPQDVRHLDGVNTPICEQLFSSINKFTNAKSMNESHFFLFFLYFFDLHNLNIERRLRSIANPMSEYRYDFIKDLKKEDDMPSAVEVDVVEEIIDVVEEVVDVVELFGNMTVKEKAGNTEEISTVKETEVLKSSTFLCKLCGSEYKKIGNLNLHMKNKHQEDCSETDINCKVCGIMFTQEKDLKKHMQSHFKCEKCSIPFEDLRAHNRHKKTYHSEIECDICTDKCTDKATYDVHMKQHLKCNICDKLFDKMFKLSRHLKTHI